LEQAKKRIFKKSLLIISTVADVMVNLVSGSNRHTTPGVVTLLGILIQPWGF
jgi:hypothetical protein